MIQPNFADGSKPAGIDTTAPPPQNPGVELTTVEKLLIIRRRRNLTVAKAARRWKLSVSTYNAWEQRKRSPRPDTERRLRKIVSDEEKIGF